MLARRRRRTSSAVAAVIKHKTGTRLAASGMGTMLAWKAIGKTSAAAATTEINLYVPKLGTETKTPSLLLSYGLPLSLTPRLPRELEPKRLNNSPDWTL